MIQRIQSLFLLLMAIAMISTLFLTVWVKGNIDTGETVVLNAFYLTLEDQSGAEPVIQAQKNVMYVSVLLILSAAISIFSIFQYKNRLNQMKLGALNSLFVLGIVGCYFFLSSKGESMLPGEQMVEYKLGFFMPVVAMLMNSIANRFIKRDEKLVKDADRMR